MSNSNIVFSRCNILYNGLLTNEQDINSLINDAEKYIPSNQNYQIASWVISYKNIISKPSFLFANHLTAGPISCNQYDFKIEATTYNTVSGQQATYTAFITIQ